MRNCADMANASYQVQGFCSRAGRAVGPAGANHTDHGSLEPRTGRPASNHPGVLQICLAGLSICCASQLAAFPHSSQTGTNSKELTVCPPVAKLSALRAFLASPPAIDMLVYQRTFFGQSLSAAQATNLLVQNAELCCGRWQPNAFYLKRILSYDDIDTPTTPGMFVGLNHGRYWSLFKDTLRYTDIPTPGPHVRSNHVAVVVELGHNAICQVINMGIIGLTPGSVRWSGMAFVGQGDSQKRYTGQLELSEEGVPTRITYLVEGDPRLSFSEFSYTRTGDLSYCIPDAFRSGWLTEDGKKVMWNEFQILTLRGSSSMLPPELFGPERFLVTNKVQVFEYSGNSIYWLHNNEKRLVRTRTAQRADSYANVGRRALPLAFVTASIVGLLLIIRKRVLA
jgi:hypothetical protein